MWAPRYFHFLGVALEAVPEERRRIGVLLLGALMLHAGGFLLLRVSYPEAAPVLTPARQRLMVYAPAPGASRMPTVADIGFWSRIDDPSLVVFPPDVATLPAEGTTASARYHASDEAGAGNGAAASVPAQAPLALVALDPDVRTLPDRLAPLTQRASDALGSAGPRQVFHYSIAPSLPAASGTAVRWAGSPAFAARAPAEWRLPAVSSDLLAEPGVTVLRLAADGQGRIAHVLVEESCGNSETDLAAVVAARRLRFAPAPAPSSDADLAWGNVAVYWKFIPKGGALSPADATPSAGTEKSP